MHISWANKIFPELDSHASKNKIHAVHPPLHQHYTLGKFSHFLVPLACSTSECPTIAALECPTIAALGWGFPTPKKYQYASALNQTEVTHLIALINFSIAHDWPHTALKQLPYLKLSLALAKGSSSRLRQLDTPLLWPKILECMHTALPADSAIVLSVVFHSTCSINQMPILILVLSPLLLDTYGNALSSTFTSILMLLPWSLQHSLPLNEPGLPFP